MTVKRYTIAEKIKMCEKAIFAEKENVSLFQSSRNFDVSNVTLYRWVKEYRTGMLTREPGKSPLGSLVDAVEEDGNGLVDPEESEQLEIIVVFDDNPDVVIKIDDPGFENHSEQIAAIKERVFSRFQIFIKV